MAMRKKLALCALLGMGVLSVAKTPIFSDRINVCRAGVCATIKTAHLRSTTHKEDMTCKNLLLLLVLQYLTLIRREAASVPIMECFGSQYNHHRRLHTDASPLVPSYFPTPRCYSLSQEILSNDPEDEHRRAGNQWES